jgi:DNA (cytosine-5)-methyltransferase 1
MDARTRPTVVDLFAGAGGLGLGFEQAGFDLVAAVELDPIHAAIHHFNFPRCATLCADATKITGAEILDKAGGRIDALVGGAPCQGFSLIGHRALDDPRNQLVKHFLRLTVETRPSVFVLENVKGLTLGRHKAFLEEVVEAFAHNGYRVVLPWKVLNARHYGVPQDRQRLFLIGVRDDLPLPEYPPRLAKEVTCSEALRDLPDADGFAVLLNSDSAPDVEYGEPSEYAREMRCLDEESWHYGYRREWNSTDLTSSMRTEHTEISLRRFSETAPGSVEPISRFYKLAANGVSNTLRAGTDSSRGAFTSPRPIHYRFNRCVTVREMA